MAEAEPSAADAAEAAAAAAADAADAEGGDPEAGAAAEEGQGEGEGEAAAGGEGGEGGEGEGGDGEGKAEGEGGDEEKPFTDWLNNPTAIVGKNIQVLWAKGKRYTGKVVRYDSFTKKHYIVYEDGDERWYNLETKTFWIEGEEEQEWSPRVLRAMRDAERRQNYGTGAGGGGGGGGGGGNYGTGGGGYRWRPYTSKTQNARMTTTFHVLIDPRAVRDGDRVVLKGNVESLGAWEGGVEMEHDEMADNIWSATVDMPFTLSDHSPQGIFQFRYEIVSANEREGIVQEGQTRVEQRCRAHLFHTFRANYRSQRFRGFAALSAKHIVQQFTNADLHRFMSDGITLPQLLERFLFIKICTHGAHRNHVEELFEDHLGDLDEGQRMSTNLVMAFLGMIGSFGLTSHEKVYTGGGYSYSYVGGFPVSNAPTTVSYRRPPKPKPWCWYCMRNLPVAELFSKTWSQEFGRQYLWCARGLTESIERVSEDGSYEWLVIYPLVAKFHLRPTVAKATKGADDRFDQVAKVVMTYVEEQTALGEAELASRAEIAAEAAAAAALAAEALAEENAARVANAGGEAVAAAPIGGDGAGAGTAAAGGAATADGAGGGGVVQMEEDLIGLSALAGVNADEEPEEPAPLLLARSWLFAVVAYAPSLAVLSSLCETSLITYAEDLVVAFVDKIQAVWFHSNTDFDVMEGIVASIGSLKCAAIAAAMLRNDSADRYTSRVVQFVHLCIAEKTAHLVPGGAEEAVAAAAAAAESKGDGVEGSNTDGNNKDGSNGGGEDDPNALEGVWLELNTAAKEWLRRNHANEPQMAQDSGGSGWGWTMVGGRRGPKKPTEKELAEQRRDCLRAAVDDLDALLQLHFFARHPQGLLFEMGRCWFFKGDSVVVLHSLLRMGGTDAGFNKYQAALAEWLLHTAQRLILDCSRTENLTRLALDVIQECLSLRSDLAHILLHALVVYATFGDVSMGEVLDTMPGLRSILDRDQMWVRIMDWQLESRDTRLARILASVRETLTNVALEIQTNDVRLREMHTVLEFSTAFLRLLELSTDAGMVTAAVLGERKQVLEHFDVRLQHLQAYASFFCSCGVRIDAAELRSLVEQLRANYNQLQMHTLPSAFDGVMAMDSLEWLFQLRSSELFLNLWRQAGRQICVRRVDGAADVLGRGRRRRRRGDGGDDSKDGAGGDGEDEMLGVAALFSDDAGDDVLGGLNAAVAGEGKAGGDEEDDEDGAKVEDPDEDDPAPAEGEDAEAAAARARERFERQDYREDILERVREMMLNQETVVTELIPQVRESWQMLCDNTFSGQLSIRVLESTFGKLNGEAQVGEELKILALTSSEHITKAVRLTARDRLLDYLLLRRLCKWLPSLLRVHELVAELCTTSLEDDPFRATLRDAIERITSQWTEQHLSSVSALVENVREIFRAYSTEQLDFLAALGSAPGLVKWLLEHSNTEEFNRLTQVCRECTDDARLLSSIPSLKHVRTLLLHPFYIIPPYLSLREFLDACSQVDLGGSDGENAMWHLNNILGSFDALIEVFEKQTRSPGIKSCYDLRDIRERGTFVLRAGRDPTNVLVLELAAKRDGAAASEGEEEGNAGSILRSKREEPMEYLLDLRSKLLMAEIPPELEEEMQASLMVDAFVTQLQVLGDMRDVVTSLFTSGHVDFQEGFEIRFRFEMDGLNFLQRRLAELQDQSKEWNTAIKRTRDEYYFLNFFTMREILRMRELVLRAHYQDAGTALTAAEAAAAAKRQQQDSERKAASSTSERKGDDGNGSRSAGNAGESDAAADSKGGDGDGDDQNDGGKKPDDAMDAPKAVAAAAAGGGNASAQDSTNENVEFMMGAGFEREWAEVALKRCDGDLNSAIDFCYSQSQFKDRILAEERATGGDGGADGAGADAFGAGGADGGHMTDAQLDGVDLFDELLLETGAATHQSLGLGEDSVAAKLEAERELMAMLYVVSSSIPEEAARTWLLENWFALLQENQESESILTSLGSCLRQTFGATSDEALGNVVVRELPRPGERAMNRADLLVQVDDSATAESEKRMPVFVSCADDPFLVIDTVLSVYVRRGRLPEPGEVLFCTTETTMEELELLIRRFIHAKSHGRGEYVFCIADLHNLSYTQQCTLVERLRSLSQEHGMEDAATLLMVSGIPRQVALNSLSSQAVDLPPLQAHELRKACEHAFMVTLGETECVGSTINGGGKSHYIMRTVADRQQGGEPLLYRRVPLRESSTPRSMVRLLNSMRKQMGERIVYHVDIGHIIPAAANTMLFELLIVGLLRDPISCRVAHRSNDDVFMLEIPNSLNNKTAIALRFCTLLPTTVLTVTAENLDLRRPVFRDALCTQIAMPDYTELKFVCKWLRAVKASKLAFGSDGYDADFSAWTDADVTQKECFDLLRENCCHADGPSPTPAWSIFHNFVSFMYHQFTALEEYPLMQGAILAGSQGLENFKNVFVRLLIETSKDFSLRSVKQANVVGPAAGSADVAGGMVPVASSEEGAATSGPAAVATGTGDGEGEGAGDPLTGALGPPPEPLSLRKQSSGTVSTSVQQAQQQADAAAPPAMVRQTSEQMVQRFQTMVSWEQSDHPVVLFKMNPHGAGVDGVDLLSLNPGYVAQYISGELKQALEQNYISFDRDWEKLTNLEGVELLRTVDGLLEHERGGEAALEAGYVLTVDNLLKLLSIQLRLKCNLPAVIMGETGCGKSTLIRNLCAILGMPLHILNVHGGMDDDDIIRWTRERIRIARRMHGGRNRMVVFFDEVNTCNSMGLFKEMVCDRSMNGLPIPENIKIIAACNPYRLRTTKSMYGGEEMAGLVFEHFQGGGLMENVGTGIKDPLRNLVYRVHPLPESMIDHIFDFGALSSETESLYIKAMLRKQLGMFNAELVEEEEAAAAAAAQEAAEAAAAAAAAEADERGLTGEDADRVMAERMQQELEAHRAPRRPSHGAGGLDADNPYAGMRVTGGGDLTHPANLASSARYRMTTFDEFVEVFSELICAAQECIRHLSDGERSAASLRDVSRCVRVFRWFGEHFNNTYGPEERWDLQQFFCIKRNAHRSIRRALILAIAYCYHARLPREERRSLVLAVVEAWRRLQSAGPANALGGFGAGCGLGAGLMQAFMQTQNIPRCRWLNLDIKSFVTILDETQRVFTQEMNLGEGIALNEALCENLFMILVSVLNQVPIFVIGKPGSSKSLAMGLVQSNLNGDASDTEFLRSLPAVEVFSYQCSPLSTSGGIEQAFDAARRYLREASNTIVVVLLDEVGLAEQSPHLPLKVLHKVLDEAGHGEAVVGISNWALDPAKMNRAVHLYRPAPTVDDLSMTAEGMVRSANLKGYLQALARAYDAVYRNQEHPDFWGLREFYSMVRSINRALNGPQDADEEAAADTAADAAAAAAAAAAAVSAVGGDTGAGGGEETSALDGPMLLNAVLRNFGGRPFELDRVVQTFFTELGLSFPMELWNVRSVERLVRQNLRQPEARHLMLLTKNNAALGLLFDREILNHERTEIIFGSDFPLDQTDLQVCLNIQQVKLCMAEGITVVLVHCESLYESLYDLLNQHYCEYGGQQYVRLAFGTHSRLCPIHKNFRVVVIVEKQEAYTKLAPPLLNRFEKQVFERRDVLDDSYKTLLERLQRFVEQFATAGGSSSSKAAAAAAAATKAAAKRKKRPAGGADEDEDWESGRVSLNKLRSAFSGYHSDLISSVILAAVHDDGIRQRRLAQERKLRKKQKQLQHQQQQQLLGKPGTPGSTSGEAGGPPGSDRKISRAEQERAEAQEKAAAGAEVGEAGDSSTERASESQEREHTLGDRSDDDDDDDGDAGPGLLFGKDAQEQYERRIFAQCVDRLLWIAAPEATCRLMSADGGSTSASMNREFDMNVAEHYFRKQKHSSLPAFAESVLENPDWRDDVGSQVVVMTYSPLSQDAPQILQEKTGWQDVSHVVLHELDQERELRSRVSDFFEEATDGSVLLVQCDPLAASLRRIEHAKFLCENARARFYARRKEEEDEQTAASAAAPGGIPAKSTMRRDTSSKEPGASEHKSGAAPGDGHHDQEHTDGKVGGEEVEGERGDAASETDVAVAIEGMDQEDEAAAAAAAGDTSGVLTPGGHKMRGADDSNLIRARGVHVILLLHLPRTSNVQSNYCASFDTRWKYAFVDSISPADAAGLPDVESMIGRTMKEVVMELDLRKVLVKSFRPSLARLVYLYERTNEDVRRQIETILRCLDSGSFVSTVKHLMENMLAQSAKELDIDIDAVSQEEKELQLAGTFQAALHAQILGTVSSMFAVALSHMDRNFGLALLLEPSLHDMWLYLFAHSFRDMNVFAVSRSTAQAANMNKRRNANSSAGRRRFGDVEVPLDGKNGRPFTARVPFSFYVSRLLESLRSVTEDRGESALVHQFALLALEHNLAEAQLPRAFMMDYVHDFTAMHCDPVASVSRESQAAMLFAILSTVSDGLGDAGADGDGEDLQDSKDGDGDAMDSKAGDDGHDSSGVQTRTSATALSATAAADPKLPCLASVHYRFWMVERVTELYFSVLGAIPSQSFEDNLRHYLQVDMTEVSDQSHHDVLRIALDALHPDQQGWTRISQYSPWISIVENVRPMLASIADLMAPDYAGRAELQATWQKLAFYVQFIKDIAIPLQLEVPHVSKLVSDLQPTSLRTREAFRLVLATLGTMNMQVLRQQRGIPDEYLCPITLERMVDPVTAADGHNYEREAIEEWFELGKRTSPSTNIALHDLTLRPNPTLQKKIASLQECDMSTFLEYFVFDVIFGNESLDAGRDAAPVKQQQQHQHQDEEGDAGAGEGKSAEPGQDRTAAADGVAADLVLDSGLLEDLVLLAAGRSADETVEARYIRDVLPSAAGKVGLLRELMNLAREASREAVRNTLREELERCVVASGFLDTPLSVCLEHVTEEQMSEGLERLEDAPVPTDADFALLSKMAPGASSVEDAIQTVSRIRTYLCSFAKLLCRALDPDDMNVTQEQRQEALRTATDEMAPNVSRILSPPKTLLGGTDGDVASAQGVVRSMRMFLLKQLERAKGMSFVRMALLEPPLEGSNWVKDWLDSGDTGFVRFLGSNRLPKVNPLTVIPGFSSAQTAVATFLNSGDAAALDAAMATCVAEHGGDVMKGALVMAMFHELYLLAALPNPPATSVVERCAEMRQWIDTSGALSFMTGPERSVVALFARIPGFEDPGVSEGKSGGAYSGSSQLLQRIAAGASAGMSAAAASVSGRGAAAAAAATGTPMDEVTECQQCLYIDQRSSADAILRVRLTAHVVATALSAHGDNPMAFFRTAMLTPGQLSESFFPSMPEDVTKMAQNVMGGRWYTCPNGHPFYVDLCGRPTVIQKCAECGADIGGTDHNLLDTNVDLGGGTDLYQKTVLEDKSDKKYCVRSVEQEEADRFFSSRLLNPTGVQVVRFLLHSALVAGCASLGEPWLAEARSIVNTAYNTADGSAFAAQLQLNWRLTKSMMNRSADDVAILLHLCLLSGPQGSINPRHMTRPTSRKVLRQFQELGPGATGRDPAAAAPGDPVPADGEDDDPVPAATVAALTPPVPTHPLGFGALQTATERAAMEARLYIMNVSPFIDNPNVADLVAKASEEFSGTEEQASALFTSELMESYSLTTMAVEDRRTSIPALWWYRRPFSFDHFVMSLNLAQDAERETPVLNAFLNQEPQLRSLRFLPQVLEWNKLLLEKFNRRLDREKARSTSIGDAFAEWEDPVQRGRAELAFEGFAAAWNEAWQHVQRFGCLEIPADFRTINMTADTQLSFCLVTEQDEGICPLALVNYLVQQHNNFVQQVDEHLLLLGREGRRDVASNPVVSSRHMTAAHSVRYDLHETFLPYVEKQCVNLQASGEVAYDFRKAEARLIDKHFTAVPAIDLELRTFSYAHEQHLTGGMAPLRQKVKQEPIPRDIEDAIRRDLGAPVKAQAVLEVLETAVSFLGATGGGFIKQLDENVANLTLHHYLKTILLLDEDLGSRVLQQQVCLKHLEGLFNLLSEITSCDTFASVSPRYKIDMDAQLKAMLERAAPDLDVPTLLMGLRDFIVSQLQEENIKADESAFEIIGWLEAGDAWFRDLEWFAESWPKAIQVQHLVDAYKVLEALQA